VYVKSAYKPSNPSVLIPVSVALSKLEYFYSSLDGMIVHSRVIPSITFASTHLYTWAERGTVRGNCLSHKHNAINHARLETQTTQ